MYRVISRRSFLKGLTALAAISTSPAFLARALQAPNPPRIVENPKTIDSTALYLGGKYVGEMCAISRPIREESFVEGVYRPVFSSLSMGVYRPILSSFSMDVLLTDVGFDTLNYYFEWGEMIDFKICLLSDIIMEFPGKIATISTTIEAAGIVNGFRNFKKLYSTITIKVCGPVSVTERE